MIADEDQDELRIDDSDEDVPQPVRQESGLVASTTQPKVQIGCIDNISERTESSDTLSDDDLTTPDELLTSF